MPQSAFNPRRPNGSGRRQPGDRIVAIFRLYRKRGVSSAFGQAGNPVQGALQTARRFIQSVSSVLGGRTLVHEIRIPLILERIVETPEVRTAFVYTREGYYVDTPQRNARGVRHVELAGRTHWEPVRVNGVAVDGDAALKEFRELIDEYFDPRNGLTASDHELYWIDLRAPVSGEDPFGEFENLIHPLRVGVRIHQVAERPFQRHFEFDFLVLRSNRDLERAEDGFLDGLLSRGALRELLDRVHLGALADFLEQVFGTVDEFQGLLDDAANVVAAVTDYVSGVTETIQAAVGLARGVEDRVQTLIGRIEDGIELAKQLPDVFGDALDQLRASFPGLRGSIMPGVFAAAELRAVRDLMRAVAVHPAAVGATVQAPERPQTIAVQVPEGATLAALAAQFDLSPEELIAANGLQYPFVEPRERPEVRLSRLKAEKARWEAENDERAAQGLPPLRLDLIAQLESEISAAEQELVDAPALPGVLYVGDEVQVPQPRRDLLPSVVGTAGNQILAVTGQKAAIEDALGRELTEEDRLFGIDLLLNEGGELEWDEDRQDLRLVAGLENILRTQLRYLKLPVGELRRAPGLGNYAYEDVSQWQGPGRNQLLAYSIWRTLTQDPRVREVRSVRSVVERGVAQVEYDATLINGKEVRELRVPV